MIWHGDARYLRIIAEERWTRELEAAANRRLLQAGKPSGTRPSALRGALVVLEHAFYKLRGKRVSPSAERDTAAPMTDAEMVRLLALLSPEAEVLRVERVPRRAERADEACACAAGSETALPS